MDVGKIKQLERAEGWIAIFALPEPPYAELAPVIKWAHVIRQSKDFVDGIIHVKGNPLGQFVSMIEPPKVFVGYVYLPVLHDVVLQNPYLTEEYRKAAAIGWDMEFEQKGGHDGEDEENQEDEEIETEHELLTLPTVDVDDPVDEQAEE
jgi:hypothetical protein